MPSTTPLSRFLSIAGALLLLLFYVTPVAAAANRPFLHQLAEYAGDFKQQLLSPFAALPANMSKALNIFKQPLALHSTSPVTGFMRNGYCEVPPSDYGTHAVAAVVTDEFLDFSAARGNDLRVLGPEMKAGCKWCLCVSRWKEAFDARGKEGDKVVPKVVLEATHEKALTKVTLDDLKAFQHQA